MYADLNFEKQAPLRCKHCNKEKGLHRAKTFECPWGTKGRAVGYTNFGPETFEAKPLKGKALIEAEFGPSNGIVSMLDIAEAINNFSRSSRASLIAEKRGTPRSSIIKPQNLLKEHNMSKIATAAKQLASLTARLGKLGTTLSALAAAPAPAAKTAKGPKAAPAKKTAKVAKAEKPAKAAKPAAKKARVAKEAPVAKKGPAAKKTAPAKKVAKAGKPAKVGKKAAADDDFPEA